MRRTLTLTFVLTILASACGGISPGAASPDDIAIAPSDKARAAKRAKPSGGPAVEIALAEMRAAPLVERKVGDFFVHRFSGSFTKQPITLSEEVVARAGGLVVIDYTLEQAGNTLSLRVTHDVESERVLRVRELRGGQEIPATTDDFDAMLAKTAFAPDSNERRLSSEQGTCIVGGDELDCDKTSYAVAIGDLSATLHVTQSKALPGRDLSGEIVDEQGNVIYRAELVDMGSGTASGVASAE
jgi:hypothetical protein